MTSEQNIPITSIQYLSHSLNHMQVVDLALLLYTNMPRWRTNPDLYIVEDARNYAQHGSFMQTLILPEHCGSHVDAPPHIHPDKAHLTIETIPVNALMGVTKKIDLSQENYGPGDLVPLSKVKEFMKASALSIEKDDIIIFEFGWDKYLLDIEKKAPHERNWWGENEPGLAEDVCRYLYESGVKAVGSDTPACDIAYINGEITAAYGHRTYFLPHGIFIVEGLHNLAQVPTTFYFMALPLKIKGGSGSPLRPIALFPKM